MTRSICVSCCLPSPASSLGHLSQTLELRWLGFLAYTDQTRCLSSDVIILFRLAQIASQVPCDYFEICCALAEVKLLPLSKKFAGADLCFRIVWGGIMSQNRSFILQESRHPNNGQHEQNSGVYHPWEIRH